MCNKVPRCLRNRNIFLATNLAKPAVHFRVTVETILFYPLFKMTQISFFLLKITKFVFMNNYGLIMKLTLRMIKKESMIKIVGALLFFAISHDVSAQYYFKDIVSSKEATKDILKIKENRIRTVKIKSFEDDGLPSDGFFAERKISKDYKKSEFFTRSNVSGKSMLTTYFDDKGNLILSSDSSEIAATRTSYQYDDDGRVKKITTSLRSSDDDFVNEILEEHLYVYDDEFLPVKMIRIKNKRDSVIILFLHDENNNISIEKDTKSGSKYYYYYDEKSRLTDIAHSNEFKPKVLSDYIFEYNTDGLLTQMTTTEEGGNDYYIWKYGYDNKLRTSERLFSKERKLMGRIEYEYEK